jgi:Domain of unknown function (DUF1844)
VATDTPTHTTDEPTLAFSSTAPGDSRQPGSASDDHPRDAIPLPAHGFEVLDGDVRELATIPAVEVISRAAVLLMSAAAEKLGLAPGEEPDIDLDEARRLITALAGLVGSAQDYLGPHRGPLHDGVRTLQQAFREASAYPDAPGEGPGEKLLA